MKPLHIGILGAARIAAKFVAGVAPSQAVTVRSVDSRDPARAQAFAQAHGVPQVAASYEALLADAQIDAVYVPLTNDQHLPMPSDFEAQQGAAAMRSSARWVMAFGMAPHKVAYATTILEANPVSASAQLSQSTASRIDDPRLMTLAA
jgi:Oxidoreductase family, NAD-binding Rossmann fold